jgi:hypothetical protein
MEQQGPATDTDPRAVIAAALARVEAAAARLTFADERDEADARRYIAQGTRAIRHHVRKATGWDGGDV